MSEDPFNDSEFLTGFYGVDFQTLSRIAQADQKQMLDSFALDTTERMSELLFMQTQTGHGAYGHGEYGSVVPPIRIDDYCLDDVIRALGESPDAVYAERLSYITDVERMIERIADGEKITQLTNEAGEPLCGNNYFARAEGYIDPEFADFFVKGFILGAHMDNLDWRNRASTYFEEHQPPIGGGFCIAVDRLQLMNTYMLTGDNHYTNYGMTQKGHTPEEIQDLKDKKIIIDAPVRTSRRMVNGYVRLHDSAGGSDDAAILCTGLLYKDSHGIEAARAAAMGVYVADWVDTFDKGVPTIIPGGHDERIGVAARKRFPGLVSDSEIERTIFCSALNNFDDVGALQDNSQRYMLQKYSGRSIFARVMDYIEASKGSLFTDFFNAAENKVQEAQRVFKTL